MARVVERGTAQTVGDMAGARVDCRLSMEVLSVARCYKALQLLFCLTLVVAGACEREEDVDVAHRQTAMMA